LKETCCCQEGDELMSEQERKEYQTVILAALLDDVGAKAWSLEY